MAHQHGIGERGCALALALLIVGSLVACGPRSWLAGGAPAVDAHKRRSAALEPTMAEGRG